MALSGVTIPGSVYVWAVVFVLPVNSALNPLLYTYSTIEWSVSYIDMSMYVRACAERSTGRVRVDEREGVEERKRKEGQKEGWLYFQNQNKFINLLGFFFQCTGKEDAVSVMPVDLTIT